MSHIVKHLSIEFNCYLNKASVPELQKFVEISDIDGANNFAPKLITQKTNC